MAQRSKKRAESLADYYDRRGVLREVGEKPVEFTPDEELRRQILEGKRTRRLQNISIKLDPAQIQALQKNRHDEVDSVPDSDPAVAGGRNPEGTSIGAEVGPSRGHGAAP